MIPLLLLALTAAPHLPGPPPPPLKGVAAVRSSALPLWQAREIRLLAGEAVVEVEEALPHLAPVIERYQVSSNLSFQFKEWLRSSPLDTPPPPVWMNPDVVTQGGNTIHQNFSLGGVR